MSYYKTICGTCPDKQWIRPGIERDDPPRHAGAGYEHDGSREEHAARLDANHPAAPVDFHEESAQQRMLARALDLIRENAPDAVFVDLDTSDQDQFGFVVADLRDANGVSLLPGEADIATAYGTAIDDAIRNEICDLDWYGVVGEDRHGYATIDLRGCQSAVSRG